MSNSNDFEHMSIEDVEPSFQSLKAKLRLYCININESGEFVTILIRDGHNHTHERRFPKNSFDQGVVKLAIQSVIFQIIDTSFVSNTP